MGRLFTAIFFAGRARRVMLCLVAAVAVGVALPARLGAANVGNTVWEDPDAEATARAVTVQLIRLASDDPQQVEQARLGIEALGMNALAPLQAALKEADRPAAEKEKIQALVDGLLDSVVVTVQDPAGRPFVNTVFTVNLLRQHGYMPDPVGPGGPEIRTLLKPDREFTSTTDGQGRLVLPAVKPVDPHLNIPHLADEGAAAVLTRRDWQPVDGFAGRVFVGLYAKKAGEILVTAVTLPRGHTPALQVQNERHRPVVGAAVIFIPADAATWAASRLNEKAFEFDNQNAVSSGGQTLLLAQSRLWNPLSALYLRLGCCSPLTDEEGLVQVGRLAPGKYALQVVASGYARLTVPEFIVPETIADEAEPTVLKLESTPRSFCAGTLKTAEGQPLKFALAWLLPAEQVYDPAHVLELQDLERRRNDLRQADWVRAGKNLADLPPAPAVPAYCAENAPLAYLEEIKNYPQVRVARSQASGRIELKELAAGKYVLRVFVGSADSMEPADLQEYVPADGQGPPTIAAKDGGPVDLGALQYAAMQAAPPAQEKAP